MLGTETFHTKMNASIGKGNVGSISQLGCDVFREVWSRQTQIQKVHASRLQLGALLFGCTMTMLCLTYGCRA